MVVRVRLTEREQEKCRRNAEQRDGVKVARGIKNLGKIPSHLSSLDLHILEVTGQYAVAKELDTEMNWTVLLGGCHKPHLYAAGYSIRVQTPTHHPPILKFNEAKDFNTDLAVLCMVEEPSVVAIYGCVSRERFLREFISKSFGYGKRLTMPSWNLTAIENYEREAERGLLALTS